MPTRPQILVAGGAGFIGSHMVLCLQRSGFEPIILDNLSKGHANIIANAKLIEGDIGDNTLLANLFQTYSFAAVMHFASLIDIAESIQYPEKYFQNNVVATEKLLASMLAYNIKSFIFSSSAAVYGEPNYIPIDENHPLEPINPYGETKRVVEELIQQYAATQNLSYIILRYFNAAGADPEGRLAENHQPESHLIPLILQAAQGIRKNVEIYGEDYPTRDGTCVRDFVHVNDLCTAHLLALKALLNPDGIKNRVYNLGTATGYSVREVIEAAIRVTGKPINIHLGERRKGDPAVLIANTDQATKVLGWQCQYPSLDQMVKDAWKAINK